MARVAPNQLGPKSVAVCLPPEALNQGSTTCAQRELLRLRAARSFPACHSLPGGVIGRNLGCIMSRWVASASVLLAIAIGSSGAASAAPGLSDPGAIATRISDERWFELEQPFTRGLRLRFDARPLPSYETLHLPTFEGTALLALSNALQFSLRERVAPAAELSCTLTCSLVLERSLSLDARLTLGRLAAPVPQTSLFARGDAVRQPRGFASRALVGLSGLLDF